MSGDQGLQLPADPLAFAESTNVSRETLLRLERYAALLIRWNKRINLVSPSTIPELWSRHMLDSAQIAEHLPENATSLIDLGSGAGFPGLVLAALCDTLSVVLVESDGRKSAFLREAAREMGISDRVEVISRRIEKIPDDPPTTVSLPAQIITARALSSLSDLLTYVEPLSGSETILLFLKGKRADEELTAANYIWHIDSQKVASRVDPDGCLLRINRFYRTKGSHHVRRHSGEDSEAAS